jgi:hypothetical protein
MFPIDVFARPGDEGCTDGTGVLGSAGQKLAPWFDGVRRGTVFSEARIRFTHHMGGGEGRFGTAEVAAGRDKSCRS